MELVLVVKSSFQARTSSRNAFEPKSQIVLAHRKSCFAEGYSVPEMCLLAPPDAIICAPSDPHFPSEYFDTLSLGVSTKSLGPTDLGPRSDLAGKPGHPPLRTFSIFYLDL